MQRVTRRQVVQGVGAVGLGLVAGCERLPGPGAPASRSWRPGWLNRGSAPWPYLDDFLGGLLNWGHVEGQNLTVEYRYASGENLAALATDLARLPLVQDQAAFSGMR